MKVTFKLFAGLSQYLPANAERHEVELEVPDGTTPHALIESHNVPLELVHLVLVDGIYLPPDQRATRALRDGEALAVFPPVAGG